MDTHTISSLAEEVRNLRHAVMAVLDNIEPRVSAGDDVELSTIEAAKFMGYSVLSLTCFRDAATSAGVYPTGNRARFRWKKSDLMKWKAAPKHSRPRVFDSAKSAMRART